MYRPAGTVHDRLHLVDGAPVNAHAPVPARDRVLDAAERLVAEHGAARLTLDAVAQAAGVSKGGLLYHFPSKEALLAGMVDRYLAMVERRTAAAAEAATGAAANPLLAHVLALLETADADRALGSALLAAAAGEPALMSACRANYAGKLERFAALPCGFERTALVLLAVDGLLLGELLRVAPFTAEQRAQAVQALIRAARDCVPDAVPVPVPGGPAGAQ